MQTNAGDQALIDAVVARDPRAMAELYRRHGGAALGHARSVVRSAAAADDVVQDVFMRFWQDPGRFDSARGSLQGFLITQARSRAMDLARSEGTRRRRQDRYAAEVVSAPSVEQEAVASLEAGAMRVLLSALPLDERAAIELAFYGANSYRRVAQLLGEPEGTIKSRIRAGLHRLRVMSERRNPVGCAAGG